MVQASETEIRAALNDIHALQVDGKWVLVDPKAEREVFSALCEAVSHCAHISVSTVGLHAACVRGRILMCVCWETLNLNPPLPPNTQNAFQTLLCIPRSWPRMS